MSRKFIEDAFCAVINLVGWNATRVHGSILNIDFGDPHLLLESVQKNGSITRRIVSIRGQWSLSICDCQWEILFLDNIVCKNTDDTIDIDKHVRLFNGQRLANVLYNEGTKLLCLNFDLGSTLKTWPAERSSDLQWQLFKGDNHYISLNQKGEIDTTP